MYSYSIMRLDTEHIDEICEDIKLQYENKVCDLALFMVKLVPEGNPVIDKATIECEKYKLFRDKLALMGLECGILVQCTIGHGWTLNELSPFTQYTNLTNGEVQRNILCPFDDGFREHMKKQFAIIASYSPKMIMLDDDFRLLLRVGSKGCACKKHMDRFNLLANTNITREELYPILENDETELGDKYREIFIRTQGEAVIDCAKYYRAGIDSVDKTIPGSFCVVGQSAEFGAEIGKIMAGENNPVIIRINNGNYTPEGTHYFSLKMRDAKIQMNLLKNDVDVFLAETDTCPQNRYSTSAQHLHAHFVGTILEGAVGAKHWITRLSSYEPQSGIAYRKKLSKYAKFYEKLGEISKTAKPFGCKIPLDNKPSYYFGRPKDEFAWPACVLERMGLPLYFSSEEGGANFLSGNAHSKFNIDEIKKMLSGTAFISYECARDFEKMGLEKYTGVKVRDWTGDVVSGEIIKINNNIAASQNHLCELVPINDTVEESSYNYFLKDGKEIEKLFPAVTYYENEFGGKVVTFCGTPAARFVINEAFSFLNYSRKLQMVSLLKKTGNLPLYFVTDEEVYFKGYYLPDNSLMCVIFNLGLDEIEEIVLDCDRKIESVSMLCPDASVKECEFISDGSILSVKQNAKTMDPVVLFLK